jgi:hypothetical protein
LAIKTKSAVTHHSRQQHLSFFLIGGIHYSPGAIASLGQTSAHEPHSMQVSGSMWYLSPSEIASTGHTEIHVPQATQLSEIT